MVDRRASERRRGGQRLWHERRSGFDRRAGDRPGATHVVGNALRTLRDRPLLLVILLVELNLLNLSDYLLTRFSLEVGVVDEVNPVMRGLFSTDPRLAGAVKLSIVLAVSLIVWRFRRFRAVLATSLAVVVVLLLVVIYQVGGWVALSA